MAIATCSEELRISVPKRPVAPSRTSPFMLSPEWTGNIRASLTIDDLSETAHELAMYQQRLNEQKPREKQRTRPCPLPHPPAKINTSLNTASQSPNGNEPASAPSATPKSAHPGFDLKSRLDDQVSPTTCMPNSPPYNGRKRADSNPASQKSSAGSECNIPREFLLRMLAPRGRTCKAMASLPGAMCGWLQPLLRTVHGHVAQKRLYFILSNSTLYAFPSNEPNTEFIESIPITHTTRVLVSEQGTLNLEIHFSTVNVAMDHHQEMAVPPELKGTVRRVMEVQCSHLDDMMAWLGALRDAILLAKQGRTPFPIIEQRYSTTSPSESPLSPFYALHMRRLTGPRSPCYMESSIEERRSSGSSASLSPHSPRRASHAKSPHGARSPYSSTSSSPLTSSPASVTSFQSISSHEQMRVGPFPPAVYSGWKEQPDSPGIPSPRSTQSPTQTHSSCRSSKEHRTSSEHKRSKPKHKEVIKLDVLDLIEAVNEAKLEKRASKSTADPTCPYSTESGVFSPTRDKKKKHILPLKIA